MICMLRVNKCEYIYGHNFHEIRTGQCFINSLPKYTIETDFPSVADEIANYAQV